MGERRIRVIPANPLLADVIKRKRTLRVAAYCRVSTDDEEQQSSFETQVKYYTEKLNSHEGWQLVGIFADEGISGVRTKKRVQFNEMIAQCRKKKIDLILTKSISRFARNTVDCIDHVRLLKRLGIAVIFEKENIDTSHMNSEMILTLLECLCTGRKRIYEWECHQRYPHGLQERKICVPVRELPGISAGSRW